MYAVKHKHITLEHNCEGAQKAPRLHTPMSWGLMLAGIDGLPTDLTKLFIVNQFVDRRVFTADGTFRVLAKCEFLKFH